MRIIFTTDTTRNLCDSCLERFPVCHQTVLEFGDGVGNDNVIKCSGYNGKMLAGFEMLGIAPKETIRKYDAALEAAEKAGE